MNQYHINRCRYFYNQYFLHVFPYFTLLTPLLQSLPRFKTSFTPSLYNLVVLLVSPFVLQVLCFCLFSTHLTPLHESLLSFKTGFTPSSCNLVFLLHSCNFLLLFLFRLVSFPCKIKLFHFY